MYKVLKAFTDLQDDNYVYLAGDEYPRKGVLIKQDRLDALASKDNARGEALIELVEEKKAAKKAQKASETAEIQPVKEEKKVVDKKAKPKKKAVKKEK